MLVKANVVAIALALAATTLAQSPQCPLLTTPLCCVTSLTISDINKVTALLPGVAEIIATFTALGGTAGIQCQPMGTGCPAPSKSLCCLNNGFGGVVAWGCNPPA